MPTMAPKPIQYLPRKETRFDAFMKRNIVIVAILGGLAIVAAIAGVAALFGHG